jgi:membrane-associated phospholipid phosphatase
MNFVSWLTEADRKVFYLINTKLSVSSLDGVMLLLRQAYTWIPLYLFFLLFFYANCRKYLVPIIALSVITFAFTDFTSASILKPLIGRLRPCHDASLPTINSISACGGLFSMPSSHASNHFGLATFWFNVIHKTLDRKWHWLFIWAFAICYSQVYVGVHYPGDVTIGALLCFVIASFTSYLFNDWMMKINNRDITTAV